MSKPLRSGYRVSLDTGGPECEAFERELEAYYGVPYARVFNSATSALIASVITMQAKKVSVPVYTMSASAASVLHAGAELMFSDVGNDYLHDGPLTHETDVAMLVHLFGHHGVIWQGLPPDILHDCAQSPTFKPEPGREADLYVYSLNQHKPISCGEGGYVLSWNKTWVDRLHAVRNHGECTTPDILGYNFRMTEMQAQVARAEFRCLDERITARRFWAAEMQERYDLPPDPGNMDWFLYPVRVKKNREEFAKRIPGARVGYHRLICDLPWFKAHGYGGDFPNARLIESELVVIDPEAYDL